MPNKLLNVATTIALGWLVSMSFAGLSFAKDRDEFPRKNCPIRMSPTPRMRPTG